MASWFESASLDGFASWMKIQAAEELSHAAKFYNFISERGGRIIFKAVAEPESEWESPEAVFQAALEHEEKISGLINNLVDLSMEEKDHAAGVFLQWFVTEQVEEEAAAGKIVGQLKLMAGQQGALYHLDKELGARTGDPAILFPGLFGV
jgi:ferritin